MKEKNKAMLYMPKREKNNSQLNCYQSPLFLEGPLGSTKRLDNH
jgi:hypothetical protein